MNFDLTNTNLIFFILGAFAAILGSGLVLFGIFNWMKKGNKISTRMDRFVAAEVQSPTKPAANQIIPREISGSLFSRTILSWVKNFIHLMERLTPERMAVDLEYKLTLIGNPANLNAGKFFAIRLLALLPGILIAFLINLDFRNIKIVSVIAGIAAIIAFSFLPVLWLNGRVKSKQSTIRRELPNALDMLSVCADAGLGFDQSIQKISTIWDTELGYEFKRVTQEMEMGISRAMALKHMSDRLSVDDLTRFIALISQAEKIGMSYAVVLHTQAIQLRILREYWAREIANTLPAKMMMPLALLIFPALLAVILGPIVPILLNIF